MSDKKAGEMIQAWREEEGLSRKQLARALGCGEETLKKIEYSWQRCTKQFAEKVAKHFLLKPKDEPPTQDYIDLMAAVEREAAEFTEKKLERRKKPSSRRRMLVVAASGFVLVVSLAATLGARYWPNWGQGTATGSLPTADQTRTTGQTSDAASVPPARTAVGAGQATGGSQSGTAGSSTPTLIEADPSVASLPFQDSFDHGLGSQWQTFDGDWQVIDGTLTNLATDGRSFIWVGSPAWTDYVVDVDIIWQRGASVSAGVNVRSGGNTGMAFAVSATDSTWWRMGNASGEDRWHYGHADVPDGPVHLRVVVKGDTYQAFLGESDPVTRTISDSTCASGFVELWSSGQVGFDNFRVSAVA